MINYVVLFFTFKPSVMPDNSSPKWRMETESLQSCNCDYGCPCNFNGLPTTGNCEGFIAFRIRKGNFDSTNIDNVKFALGVWWPKAIHEGEGIGALYIDTEATPEQVKAIEEITSGKHGGGIFAILPMTLKQLFPTKITKIDFHHDPYDASFNIEGVGKAKSEHILNPVTEDQFEGEVYLPGGISFKRASVSSVNWDWNEGDLSFSHEKKNGHASVATFTNEGCIA